MKEPINPEETGAFRIPPSLLEKLYDFTGDSSSQTKGFLLAYTDQNGNPVVLSRAGTQIIEMGIRKALEKYLMESSITPIPSSNYHPLLMKMISITKTHK